MQQASGAFPDRDNDGDGTSKSNRGQRRTHMVLGRVSLYIIVLVVPGIRLSGMIVADVGIIS